MKKIIFCSKIFLLSALICFLGLKAQAKTSNDTKLSVAYIDSQFLQKELLVVKDMHNKTIAKEKKIQEVMMKKQNELQKKATSLNNKKSMITQDQYYREAGAIEMERQQLYLEQQKYAKVFEMTNLAIMQDIQTDIVKAVNKLSVDKYDIVLPLEVVMYIDKSKFTNLSKDVVSKVNSTSKTVNFDKIFEQAEKKYDEFIKEQTSQQKNASK